MLKNKMASCSVLVVFIVSVIGIFGGKQCSFTSVSNHHKQISCKVFGQQTETCFHFLHVYPPISWHTKMSRPEIYETNVLVKITLFFRVSNTTEQYFCVCV